MEAMKTKDLPVVILRPGTIYGPGGDLFSPMMGFSLFNKAFIVIGNGKFELPFVYIDNLVEAIIKSIQSEKANNDIFNVVDSERITKKNYMQQLIMKLYPKAWKFYFPYSLLYFIILCQEVLFSALKRKPFLTRYRLVSSQRNIKYDNSKIVNKLNWNPKVSFAGAVSALMDYEKHN